MEKLLQLTVEVHWLISFTAESESSEDHGIRQNIGKGDIYPNLQVIKFLFSIKPFFWDLL